MIEAIILSIMAIIGISFSITKAKTFQKIISFGLSFSIFITWIGDKNILLVSLLLLTMASLLTFIYGLTIKEISKIERISICFIGLLFAVTIFSKIMYWQGANLMKIILTFPFITYLTGLIINKKAITNETGFMIIWLSLLVIEIVKIWT